MASTGNTQGMRLRMSPPSSAPASASSQVASGAGVAGMGCALAALAFKAASSAGDMPTGAATAGQPPATGSSTRQPWPPWASTMGRGSGPSLRSRDSGTRAVQTAPSHCWVGVAAVSMTPVVSGKTPSALPCSAAGRPATRSSRAPPSTRAPLPSCVGRGTGWALAAASKAAALSAVVPARGSCSVKSPSSGMHSWRHTNHDALSRNVTSRASGPGLKAGDTVTGTGSSTVPS